MEQRTARGAQAARSAEKPAKSPRRPSPRPPNEIPSLREVADTALIEDLVEGVIDDPAGEDAEPAPIVSPAVRMNFEFLIPIWGEPYIRRFAELGLRSLLAPRNLPSLSEHHSVAVTMLTTREGRDHCGHFPGFARLASIADISFVEIDDLLGTYGRNYSVILTRAYNRAMALSPDLVGRNFMFLVGDQVFADGALETIARAMQAGADACLACTPRIEAEVAERVLAEKGTPVELTLPNRELMELLLNSPHPTLVAKIVQDDTVHLSVAHQFFWRPAPETFVSRCFLLHMLCIRPTRRPSDIAAFCDFSFAAELAPEGRYHYLTDSDDFLALELQPVAHETEFITPYELGPADVAESIAAWATPLHHQSVGPTFVFRGGSSTYPAAAAAELTQGYIDKIVNRLSPPKDLRHHPFWLGAVGAQLLFAPAENSDVSEVPAVLRRLIGAHLDKLGSLDLAVSIATQALQLDGILARSARTAVRISPGIAYRQIEDVAGPGGTLLVVLTGGVRDFLELFSDRNRLARLVRVAGPGRPLLLCYHISLNELRTGSPGRLQLHQTFAARLSVFAKFGLAARIHDLASAPLDNSHGFIIEVTADDSPAGVSSKPRAVDPEDDPLIGRRGAFSVIRATRDAQQ